MRLYKLPYALGFDEWDELYEELEREYPIQFFVRHTVPRFVGKWTYRFSHRVKWPLIHRFHPKHQYHVIKPRSLKPGYHDPLNQIQATAFDTLSSFAENSLMGDGIDGTKWRQEDFDYYDKPENVDHGKEHFYEQVRREKQIIDLRNWWVIERPVREEKDRVEYPDGRPEWGDHWVLSNKYDDTPEYAAFRESSEKNRVLEEQWAEDDNKKFHELVDLLPHLWY